MKRVLLTLVMLTFFAATSQAEEVISFATVNWEPYASETVKDYGFTSVIIAEACKRAGYKAEFNFMPWNRALNVVKKGDFDAVYNGYYSKERAEQYALSESYANGPLTLIAKKGSGISYGGDLKGLSKYMIGIVKGYAYTPEFDEAGYLKKEEASSDLTNLKKLLGDRVDVIAMDKYVALSLVQSDPGLKGKSDQLDFLTPPLGDNKLYVLFSKNRPGTDKKLAAFNKGLKEIHADGTVQKIMKRFGF